MALIWKDIGYGKSYNLVRVDVTPITNIEPHPFTVKLEVIPMDTKRYIIALDVGGSYIKSVVLNECCEILHDTLEIFPSKSHESKDIILNHLAAIIKNQFEKVNSDQVKLKGVGFAFPGPFDYEKGISYIKGVDKFDHLYGVNLREELKSGLHKDKDMLSKMDDGFVIAFDNDANLFALGEYKSGKGKHHQKAIFLTIGTGAGSAFIEHGELVKSGNRVPENGWIYQEPFGDSVVDDYISKRGVLKIAEELGIEVIDGEVKTLAEMANDGNPKAREVFAHFGRNIGKALNPYIKSFNPNAVILGGQISKSIELFKDGIFQTLENKDIIVEISENTSLSTFVGIGMLIDQMKKDV